MSKFTVTVEFHNLYGEVLFNLEVYLKGYKLLSFKPEISGEKFEWKKMVKACKKCDSYSIVLSPNEECNVSVNNGIVSFCVNYGYSAEISVSIPAADCLEAFSKIRDEIEEDEEDE